MKTVVISSQRITVEAHEAIKTKAKKEICSQQVIIRKILHDWAENAKPKGK